MKYLSLILGWTVLSLSCTPDFAQQSEADVILRIVKIIGLEGSSQEEGDVLLSDVTPVFNDNARLTFEAIPVNPNPTQVIGQFNDVFLERCEVRFFRTDGRNVEGVDVPYRFTNAMATLVRVNTETEAVILLVRHTAKEEPPLRNLAFLPQSDIVNGPGGGQGIIHAIAEITVHGRTTNGKAVSVVGRLSVTFADFADTAAPTTPSPSPLASPSPAS